MGLWTAGTASCLGLLLPPWGGIRGGECGIDSIFPNIITTTPTLIMSNVFEIDRSGKKENQVCCPHCASTLIVRHGFYSRAHPKEEREVSVQRYFCKSPICPWKTFSVLPYPFLPFIRHFHKTLLFCHYLFYGKHTRQADTARRLNITRGVAKRLVSFCWRFIPWLNHEKRVAEWGPSPQKSSAAFWPDFTRDFSQAFYPQRWSAPVPT